MGACLLFVNSSSIWAQQVTEETRVNQLMIKLQERDKVIADLQRRVEQLEQRVGGTQQDSESAAAAQPAAEPATKTVADQPVRQAQGDEPAKKTSSAAAAQNKKGPGTFEVDEEAAERALERTLVQTGALLLPFGQAEVQPYVNYIRFETEQPVLLSNAEGNIAGVADIRNRRNDIEAGVFFRLGLPFDAQAELSVPARVINQSSVVGLINQETVNSTHMLGDVRVGLAKTLLRESAWLPDIIGRITWDTATGKLTLNNPQLGGLATGFDDLTFSLTALKRQDPLAFTGTLSYRKTFKKDGFEPGDVYSLALGATLAASPQTSLSLGIQQSFINGVRIFDNTVPGSDAINSLFTFGAASTVGSRLFFTTNAGIGITKNAPDYFISVAIPLRLDVPFQRMLNAN
ncbi:hypothetical protein SAMN05428977_105911 [Nitrosomonas sp. Nm166]|nr:hypothetical protein SAMN05428977_105911 [Nitrosomonas sp. Nm166]